MPRSRAGLSGRAVLRLLAVLPSIVGAALPVGLCPACWPAYAAVLGSLGLGFLLDRAYLAPVMLVALVLSLLALGYGAGTRRGHGPLGLGVVGAAAILVGKFLLDWNPAVYGGAAILFGAAVWNVWPRKVAAVGACPACQKAGRGGESTRA